MHFVRYHIPIPDPDDPADPVDPVDTDKPVDQPVEKEKEEEKEAKDEAQVTSASGTSNYQNSATSKYIVEEDETGYSFKTDGPVPKIVSISPEGVVVITFDREVFEADLEDVNNGTVLVKKELLPAFQVEVTPGLDSDMENLKFEWVAIEATKRTLTLQLVFENPIFVSAFGEADNLKVTFRDPQLFFSATGYVIPKRYRVLSKRLPRLLPNGAE